MEGENSDPTSEDPSVPIEAPSGDQQVDASPADVHPPSTADDAETSVPATRTSQQSNILDMVASLFFRRESVNSTASAEAPEGGAVSSEASLQQPQAETEVDITILPEAGICAGNDEESGEAVPNSISEEQQVSEPAEPTSPSGGILSAVSSLFRSRQSADGGEAPTGGDDNQGTSMIPVGRDEQEGSPSNLLGTQGPPEGESAHSGTADLPDTKEAIDSLVAAPKPVGSIDSSSATESTGILAAIASMFRRRSSIYDYDGGPQETSAPATYDDEGGAPIPLADTLESSVPLQALDRDTTVLPLADASESLKIPEDVETAPTLIQSLPLEKVTFDDSYSADLQPINPQNASVSSETDDRSGSQSSPQHHRRTTSEGVSSGASALNGENDLDEDELLQIALQISIEEGSRHKSLHPRGPLSPGKLDKSKSSRRSSFKTTFTSKDAHEGWAIEENVSNAVTNGTEPYQETTLSTPAIPEPPEKLTRSQKYEKAMRKLEDNPDLVDEIRFARRYRRASLVPEQDLDLYPAAEPDCGKVGKKPHLSRAHAIETTEQFRMGFYEEGQRKPFPLSCSFGWHRWPFSTYEQTDNGVLVDYGLGVSLYFKLVKALILLFFFMNICTLPPMLMYILGDSIQPIQRRYYKDTNNQNILGTTTMASLGQPFPVCQKVGVNQTFQFSCPGEARIQSIVAYYGQPRGSCTCPGVQQPDSQGNCIGTVSGTVQNSLSNQLNYKGQQCVADASGYVAPCFLGLTRFGINCCSSSLDSNGNADLVALSLSANLQCNSFTAQYIAESLCLNQNSCSFVVEVS